MAAEIVIDGLIYAAKRRVGLFHVDQHRFMTVCSGIFPDGHRLNLTIDADHTRKQPSGMQQAQKLFDGPRLQFQNSLPFLRHFQQLLMVNPLQEIQNLPGRLRRDFFISIVIGPPEIIQMVLLLVQLPSGEIHQILPQIDIVIIIPVVDQFHLAAVNLLQQECQGCRDQGDFKPFPLALENLLRCIYGFPQLVLLIGSCSGQRKGHEILFLFGFQGPQSGNTQVVSDDLPRDLMGISPDIVGNQGMAGCLIIVTIEIRIQQCRVFFCQFFKVSLKNHAVFFPILQWQKSL